MKDEELKAQINDIIEGEIQNGINDYLEAQEDKEDSGVGFVSDEAKELNVKVYRFLKNAIIKNWGKEFFHQLEIVDSNLDR